MFGGIQGEKPAETLACKINILRHFHNPLKRAIRSVGQGVGRFPLANKGEAVWVRTAYLRHADPVRLRANSVNPAQSNIAAPATPTTVIPASPVGGMVGS